MSPVVHAIDSVKEIVAIWYRGLFIKIFSRIVVRWDQRNLSSSFFNRNLKPQLGSFHFLNKGLCVKHNASLSITEWVPDLVTKWGAITLNKITDRASEIVLSLNLYTV